MCLYVGACLCHYTKKKHTTKQQTCKGRERACHLLSKRKSQQPFLEHCLTYSLNLCLQDVGWQIRLLSDALDIVKEIAGLIQCSLKHLFHEKMLQRKGPKCGSKPFCCTHWTVRWKQLMLWFNNSQWSWIPWKKFTKQHMMNIVWRLLEFLLLLETFDLFFGLKLGYLLFSAAEETAKTL